MRTYAILTVYNRATCPDHTQAIMQEKCVPKVSFACAIYLTSKHVYKCVGACTCDCMPALKGPQVAFKLENFFSKKVGQPGVLSG